MRLAQTVALALGITLAGPLAAQEFVAINDGRFGELRGAISNNGSVRLEQFLREHPNLLGLSLNSPGGVVVEALEMAELVHKRRLGTFVSQNSICASACSLLFFAGYDRLAKGPLGVHQMDDGGRGTAGALQYVLADVLDALNDYEVPWEVSRRMLKTPPDQMYWIPPQKLDELALNRDLPGDALTGRPPPKSVPFAASFSAYPADEFLAGPPRLPDFEGRDADYRTFRTRIRNGAKSGPNFAGYTSVVEIGCGTNCKHVYVVDLRTGRVWPFPYGWDQFELQLLYTPDSRLLKVTWAETSDTFSDSNTDSCVEQDLLFSDMQFQVISERRLPRGHYCDGFSTYVATKQR